MKYQKIQNNFFNLQIEKQNYMNLVMEQKKRIEKQDHQLYVQNCTIEEQNKKIIELKNLLILSDNRIQFIESEKENAENNLKVIIDSNIYRATKPLRMTLDILKKMFSS